MSIVPIIKIAFLNWMKYLTGGETRQNKLGCEILHHIWNLVKEYFNGRLYDEKVIAKGICIFAFANESMKELTLLLIASFCINMKI